MRINKSVFPIATLLGLAALAPSASAGPIAYAITVDTSSAFGQAGYIDIQFNYGDITSQFATLDVTDFSTDGTLDPGAAFTGITGDVAGLLPGDLMFDNGQPTNEYTEGIVFGNTVNFRVTFDGPAIESPDGSPGSLFNLDFLNSNLSAFLFTADPEGNNPFDFNVATIAINPDGSTTPVTYPDVGGTSDASVSQVPEPSTLLLFGTALLGLGSRRGKKGT